MGLHASELQSQVRLYRSHNNELFKNSTFPLSSPSLTLKQLLKAKLDVTMYLGHLQCGRRRCSSGNSCVPFKVQKQLCESRKGMQPFWWGRHELLSLPCCRCYQDQGLVELLVDGCSIHKSDWWMLSFSLAFTMCSQDIASLVCTRKGQKLNPKNEKYLSIFL